MSATSERTGAEHVVGKVDDLPPGRHMVVQVNSLEIGVYNVGGTFYALHNMCPHQFGPACAGPVSAEVICGDATDWQIQIVREGEILVCPWHGMEFDLKTGQCLTMKRMRIRSFPIRVEDGEIRVQIGGRRPAAAPQPVPFVSHRSA